MSYRQVRAINGYIRCIDGRYRNSKISIDIRTSTLRRNSSSSNISDERVGTPNKNRKQQIYCDLDGVLCDFDRGVGDIFNGRRPDAIKPSSLLWSRLATTPNFYSNLQWTTNGKALWDKIKVHTPIILSGVPNGKWSHAQKRLWVVNNLGEHVHVILCKTKEKHLHCNSDDSSSSSGITKEKDAVCRGDILIDDRLMLKDMWEQQGGVFIHYDDTEYTKAMIEIDKYL